MSALDDMRLRRNPETPLARKLLYLNWGLVLLVLALAAVGTAMLYSAANGSFEPWAWAHMARVAGGLLLLLAVALTDIRLWFRAAYPFYALCLLLLIIVEVKGMVGMGAQRWINLGFMQLQPSELMKVALLLALARYFHGIAHRDLRHPLYLLVPLALALTPAALVLRQPDLGTAAMLLMGAGTLFFLAGVRLWKFALVAAGIGALVPIAWSFLHDYQKRRVLVFLDPSTDPLGAGYHITQSKIALGSGGLFGKGFLEGTQGHLNFLPERQTDFIFTMLAEEFGLVGALVLLGLYLLVFIYGVAIALSAGSQFGRLLAMGLTANLFFYVFINMAMVMGLLPVVGVPLPLVSYGGTVILTTMLSLGLILNVRIHRDYHIPRRGLRNAP
ncbi:rod shape-determining protein RodA [Fodinicurvata sp. CAU 1616]|uniref:Peptidoglycan glycosyltransferase MrdB n=2 Tax=Aquibaculum arenosum TaxID=3032591 RepID=A0ABT5YPP6_9PROT|nr:rod shape-determining protein RodA [Fodinicurvata sp. CAU 1616]